MWGPRFPTQTNMYSRILWMDTYFQEWSIYKNNGKNSFYNGPFIFYLSDWWERPLQTCGYYCFPGHSFENACEEKIARRYYYLINEVIWATRILMGIVHLLLNLFFEVGWLQFLGVDGNDQIIIFFIVNAGIPNIHLPHTWKYSRTFMHT